mmetsp:Transcript_5967/g.11544  ORF Transcript_5967/g.11544 Transcript_5967/m.11544 type:complete len:428 (-) Transcript_5967:672-1955(-)
MRQLLLLLLGLRPVLVKRRGLIEVVDAVVLHKLDHRRPAAEPVGVPQIFEPDREASFPQRQLFAELVRRRPSVLVCHPVSTVAGDNVADELLLRLQSLVIAAHSHVSFDDHGKQKVLDEEEDEHEVEHRVQLQVHVLVPCLGELSERHHEERLARPLQVAEVLAVASEAPGPDSAKAEHQQHDEDSGMPQVIPGLDQGALEEGEARVHGGALDEAEEGEDEDKVAELVEVALLADELLQRVHRLEKLRHLELTRQLSVAPVDHAQRPDGVCGVGRGRDLARDAPSDVEDDEAGDDRVDEVLDQLLQRRHHTPHHKQPLPKLRLLPGLPPKQHRPARVVSWRRGRECGQTLDLCCLLCTLPQNVSFLLRRCALLRHHSEESVLEADSNVHHHDGDVDEHEDLHDNVDIQAASLQQLVVLDGNIYLRRR